MKRNIIFASLLFTTINLNCCFAAFDYNGTFSANRSSNEPQVYYILLNENTTVSFSFKSEGKDCKDVFVSSIKLSSDESVFLTSKTGITTYSIPASGIYEVSVTSSAPLNKVVSYDLTVEETEVNSKVTNNTSINTNNTNTSNTNNTIADTNTNTSINTVNINQNSPSIGTAKIIDESEPKQNNELGQTELPIETNKEIQNNQTENKSDISLNISNQEVKESETKIPPENNIISNVVASEPVKEEIIVEEPIKPAIADPLGANTVAVEDEYSELDPDTPAIEDDEEEVPQQQTPVTAKSLKYKGKLELVNSFDVFRFLGDKNKCWPKAICFDSFDNIWILDGQLCHVICYDSKGKELKSFGSKGKSNYELGIPVSLTVFNNYILIGDRQKKCIHVFNKDGNWVNAIQNDPNVGLKISNPISLCIRNNELWVGDAGTQRILCFNAQLAFLGSFGSTKESKIDSISAISSDNESIFILDDEGILKKFGTMGNFISAIPTDYKFSENLFVDKNKNYWIANSEKGKVSCFSEDGKILFSIDRKSLKGIYAESDKFSPSAVTLSLSAKIAVADTYSKQIKIFEIK
jgi:hypothetical protein